jgi:hypothetical protein
MSTRETKLLWSAQTRRRRRTRQSTTNVVEPPPRRLGRTAGVAPAGRRRKKVAWQFVSRNDDKGKGKKLGGEEKEEEAK